MNFILPVEILIEIFKHLNDKDLLATTLVCTSFNDIISSSKELSSKLKIYLKKNEFPWMKTKRHHETLIIDNFCMQTHNIVLTDVGQNIKKIEFNRWNWSLDHCLLYEVFRHLPSVRHVKFNKILFHSHIQFINCINDLHNLDSLEVLESDSRIFKLFKKVQVKRLHYDYVPSGGNFPIPDFIKFLQRQDDLRELTLSGFIAFINAGIGKIIFHNNSLSSVKFRLTKLCLKDSPICETIHFNNFIDLHIDSLKVIDFDGLENWNCSRFIQNCKSINELRINKKHKTFNFEHFESCESVTKLKVSGPIDKKFIAKFPNIKILNVQNLKTNRNNFDEELNCNQIEEMSIEKTWLGGFYKFPKLKKFHLKYIRVMSGEIFRVNNQIEELIIEGCDDLCNFDDVLISIRENLKNLRNFKII